MKNIIYNRNLTTENCKIMKKSSFALNGIASARMALRLGYTLGTVFVICASNTYADVVNAPIKSSDRQLTVNSNLTSLPTIIVKAEQEDDYAGGQVSSKNSLGFLGDKSVMETPFNTVSYTEKYIADIQAKDITDIIAKADPTVIASGVAGENLESYSIRGFASDIGDVTVNGLAGMAPYYRSTPEMFSRVDVLKGPSALLNGMPPKGSVGGAVNLVTKRATEIPLTRITANYTSDAQFGGHVDLGRRFGENNAFGVRFNGVYRDGEKAINNQEQKVQFGSLALDWRGNRSRLSADFYLNKERTDGPTRGLTLATGVALPKPPKPETLLNPTWAFNDVEDKGVILRGEFDINEQTMIYATVGKSGFDYEAINSGTTEIINANGDFRTNLGAVADTADRKSAEAGIKTKFNTGTINHQLVLNTTYYNEDYNLIASRGVLAPGQFVVTNIYHPVWGNPPLTFNPVPITQTETTLTSIGLADTLSFLQDKLQFTLGGRYQKVETGGFNYLTNAPSEKYDENVITPAAAVLFKVNDKVSVYGNYVEGLSQGARAPLTAENAGKVFAPYKSKQKEIGIKVDFSGFVNTFSAYEIERPSSYTDINTNIFSFGGEQRNRGLEWGFVGSPIQDVRLMGGVTYTDAKLNKTNGGTNQGNQAVGVPKMQSKLGIEWDVPVIENLTFTSNATSVQKSYLDTANTLSVPGYTIFDLGARYKTSFNETPMIFRANVSNLTNKAYWAKPYYTSLGLGAPRTFMLSATVDF